MGMKEIIFVIGVILTVAGLLVVGIAWWEKLTIVDYNFNNAVHSHMENAYFSSDPITMRSELNLSIEGMKDLGLTDNLYNAVFPWDRIPNNRMDWQYKHMASILTRINEWEKWEIAQGNSSAGSQQMQDVNTQKLDNARSFIRSGGWSDDVAQGAYLINFYLTVWWGFVIGSIITGVGISFVLIVIIVSKDER